ncbi:MAG: multicopper oxidase domain-containing protein [Rhodanobacteraceae bacterium]|nr:multicopper oxidase domain-containing protein [Rhodanobacteraceae bacterium]
MTNRARRHIVLSAVTAAATLAGWRLWHGRKPDRTTANSTPSTPAAADTSQALASRERFSQPLRLPLHDVHFGELAVSSQTLELVATRSQVAVFPGAPTPLWHYAARSAAATVLNPLLRIRRGETLSVHFRNELAEETTIHWHGLIVDEANDGSGLHPVAPGTERDYQVQVTNRAGLYWYHAHPHGRTGLQVQRGLAGLLLVEDAEEAALRKHLGLVWGERDLPLCIADKQVDAGNALVYPEQGADDWIGNRVLVNWTPEPYLDVAAALYRFRIANTANARLLRLAFQHAGRSLPFRLIGTDGGLLGGALRVEDVFLAPAQRIDVLVDFSAIKPGERVLLRSLDYVAMENEDESGDFMPDPMGDHPGAMPMGAALDILEFRVGAALPGREAVIPDQLSTLAPLPDTSAWPTRSLRLRMDAAGGWFINDWNFLRDGHAVAFAVKRGTCEVWEIRNSMTSMPHPVHVHGFQFRVVSRSVSPMDVRARQVASGGRTPQDLGWTDTVLVWPGEVVRLAMDFSQPYRGTQRYMLHCHNLEHEDMGMMLTFAVTD